MRRWGLAFAFLLPLLRGNIVMCNHRNFTSWRQVVIWQAQRAPNGSVNSNWVSRTQRHDECGPGQTRPVCNVIPGIVERQQSHHCLSAAENTDLLILCRLAAPPGPLLCAYATFSSVLRNRNFSLTICLLETACCWLYRPPRQQKAQDIAPSQ